MQLTKKMARRYTRRIPASVRTSADFLVWWMTNFDRTDRLRAAMNWWMMPGRGPTSEAWREFQSMNYTETAANLTCTQKSQISEDVREYVLLIDWMISTQMAELRSGYQRRGQLRTVGID